MCGIIQVCLFAVAILYVMVAKKAKDQLMQKDLEGGDDPDQVPLLES